MDAPHIEGGSVFQSRLPETVAKEFDSCRPESRRPVVTYHVLGADADLVPHNSWNRVERFQPSLSAFFRSVHLPSFSARLGVTICWRNLVHLARFAVDSAFSNSNLMFSPHDVPARRWVQKMSTPLATNVPSL